MFHEEALHQPRTIASTRDRWGALETIPAHMKPILAALDGLSWETGLDRDDDRGVVAINTSLYDIGWDRTKVLNQRTPLPIAVLQIRLWMPQANEFNMVLKNYALVGRNEDGSVFSHPVSWRVRHNAKKQPIGAICARAQAQIFGVKVDDLSSLHRQGDVALRPLKRAPAGARRFKAPLSVMDEHWLIGATRTFGPRRAITAVEDPVLQHKKGEHETIRLKGLYAIHRGQREQWHDFSEATPD